MNAYRIKATVKWPKSENGLVTRVEEIAIGVDAFAALGNFLKTLPAGSSLLDFHVWRRS